MRDSHSEPAPGLSQPGDVTTFPGAGPVDPSLPSSQPACLETFTIPPAALEAARQREADDELAGWEPSVPADAGAAESPPPELLSLGEPSPGFFTSSSPSLPLLSPEFLVPDDGSEDARQADGPGPDSAPRHRRRRYSLVLLLVMVFGILLIVAAAVSRSIRSVASSSEYDLEQPGSDALLPPSAVAPSAVAPSAVAPSAVAPSAVAPSAVAPSEELAVPPLPEPVVSATSPVKRAPVPRRPENPPKVREFLYESAYPESPH